MRDSSHLLSSSLGIGLVALASFAYAVNIVLARLVYDGGGDPLTLLFSRSALLGLMIALVLWSRGRPLRLQRRDSYATLGVGVLLALQGYGYYGSVQYIPASLAVLIVYIYPLIVALAARIFDGEPLSSVRVIALLAGFTGVALAVQVSVGSLDWRGIVLAVWGGVGLAAVIVICNRILRRVDSARTVLHITLSSAITYAIAFCVTGGPTWPATEIGQLSFAVVSLSYILCLLPFLTAIPLIGATRASIVGNSEPIFVLVLASLVLDEHLNYLQLAGAGLVIGAILVLQLWNAPAKICSE